MPPQPEAGVPSDAGVRIDTGSTSSPEPDAGGVNPRSDAEPEPDPMPALCPDSLGDRLRVTTVEVGSDIRYKKVGYDQYPLDESILLSTSANGRTLVAARENNGTRIRVVALLLADM